MFVVAIPRFCWVYSHNKIRCNILLLFLFRFTVGISETTDRPYYVNITIPNIEERFNDITEGSFNDNTEGSFNDITRGRRGAGFPVLGTSYPSANEIDRTVGFYSFGLRTLYPPAFIDTPPSLVRYSGIYFLFLYFYYFYYYYASTHYGNIICQKTSHNLLLIPIH